MIATAYKATDYEFEEYRIERVTPDPDGRGYELQFDGSLCCWIPNKGIVPHEGDTLRQYGQGFGFPFRGVDINGQTVFYRTPAQQAAKHKREVAAGDRKKRRAFERNRAAMDARYTALPEPFRRRLDRFRAGNPEFRWQFEGYELFACEQAVILATALKTPAKVAAFHKRTDWAKQKAAVPGLDDGHSGNTFDVACGLARLYLTDPALVIGAHGALTMLVGCKDYGCTHEAVA